jgi:tRNA(Ile)-lysidine synthase
VLTPDRVAALTRRTLSSIELPKTGKTVIALSGGSDSTALLMLAHAMFSDRGEADRLLAVTVDHGLRAESADEARRVGAMCAARGIAHDIRRWDGPKPATGLQAAARAARYRLLAGAAEDAGGTIVLTGHTLDDQQETVAMRAARGPGRGLSGIAPATLYARRTWFVRPLLARRRQELRDWLETTGQGWIDDPSNSDRRFERVRVRQDAPDHAADDAEIRAAFAARQAGAARAAALLRDTAVWRFDAAGRTAEFSPGAAAGREGFALALGAAMSWTGQCPNLASQGILDKAARFAAEAAPGKRMTASGCLLEKAGESVRITREARNRRESGYGFDHLLSSPDFEAAQALAERTRAPSYPNPPISGYPV